MYYRNWEEEVRNILTCVYLSMITPGIKIHLVWTNDKSRALSTYLNPHKTHWRFLEFLRLRHSEVPHLTSSFLFLGNSVNVKSNASKTLSEKPKFQQWQDKPSILGVILCQQRWHQFDYKQEECFFLFNNGCHFIRSSQKHCAWNSDSNYTDSGI